ncbi:MAG TPA: hypothetical protein VMG12_28140 [Polyangiaceae bacterium]|nr:hypothetical protein [Polyangiaceae bacterium]
MSLCCFECRASFTRSPLGRRSLSRCTTFALFATALALSACSDEGGGPGADGADGEALLAAAAACGAESHEPCDVLAPECQSRLAEIAACQWGGAGTTPVLPPIDVVTRAMLRDRLATAVAADTTPAPVSLAVTAVLEMLGLLPASFDSGDAVDVAANLLLAQYDPATDRIILIEDARTGDPIVDNEVLFHELIHAQQAARYDLQALLASTTTLDSLIGIRALFEGEAQFHQLILDFGMFDAPIQADALRQGLDTFRDAQSDALFAEPQGAWNRSLLLAPYIYGPYSILDTWLSGGPAAMAQRYASPPGDSLDMLEGALAPGAVSGLVDAFPTNNIFARAGAALPVAGDEAYPLGIDRLGAWTTYVLARLAGSSISDADAEALALGWRGDQLDIFQLDAGGYAGRYRVRFDTDAHASQFEALMQQNPNADVRTSNAFVAVTIMAEGETPEWLFGPLAR